MVKNLPAMQETVQSLDREDCLEEGMATHSSILARRIPWTEELYSRLQSIALQKVRHNWSDLVHIHTRTQCDVNFHTYFGGLYGDPTILENS